MNTIFTSETNVFQPKSFSDDNSLESIQISEQDSSSDVTGSVEESIRSAPKKFKIKTKSRSNSEDSLSDSGSKKARKSRTTKPNALEKYGFNPELTWTFPKLKKYLDDSGRACVSRSTINSDTDTTIGFLYTFRKGVKEESILIITKFEPDWLADQNFNSYISAFSGKSAKSSRLVIIHHAAKAWGAKKVTEALSKIKDINDTLSTSSILESPHTIKFNDNNLKDDTGELADLPIQDAAYLLLEVAAPKTIKTLSNSLDFNTEFASLTRDFQAQMESAQKSYQQNLAQLISSVTQSTSC